MSLSVAENACAQSLSPFRLSGWILGFEDDADDAGDRLEGELGLQRLHHRAQRGQKPMCTKF